MINPAILKAFGSPVSGENLTKGQRGRGAECNGLSHVLHVIYIKDEHSLPDISGYGGWVAYKNSTEEGFALKHFAELGYNISEFCADLEHAQALPPMDHLVCYVS